MRLTMSRSWVAISTVVPVRLMRTRSCMMPTGNIDPETAVGIMQLLVRINRTGTTVLIATHDRDMVNRMRRRVLQLEAGRLVRDERRGSYDQVTEEVGDAL